MRRLAAVVLGATLLALPACGSKTDEASRAAGITPATALGMVSVNLSPSIDQKRNLLSIARQFPGARSKVKGEFDDARNELLGTLFQGSGLDFKNDIQPWLGKEAAVVVLPPGDAGAPLILGMVQTEDQEKAKAAIAKATRDGGFDGAYAIVDDFVVISRQADKVDNQPALDQITAQAKKDDGGLAKSAEFTNVVDQLHGDRLVLGWVDTKHSLAALEDLGGLKDVVGQLGKDAGAVGFDLHAESKAVVFQGIAAAKGVDSGSDLALTRSLPATTLGAFTSFAIGKSVARALAGAGGTEEGNLVAGFEQQTGLNLEKDILSWMHGEVVLVAGAVRGEQPFPDFALVVEPTDKDKALAGLAKIRSALSEKGLQLDEQQIGDVTSYVAQSEIIPGIQPAMALFPDRFVVANSAAFLADLAKAAVPGLGDDDAYTSVVGGGGTTSAQFVLLIDPIRQAIEQVALKYPSDRAEYEKDVKPNLEPLSAFGFRAHRDGGYNRFEMKLTFD